MRLMIVVGARPQFIKAAALSWGIEEWNRQEESSSFEEVLIHTGQHYDYEMSQSFFEELLLPKPTVNLEVGSASHAVQTAKMTIGLEGKMEELSPDWVVVLGDTNSTLAGALAAAKLKIPVAHVESGLRRHNRAVPEEVNRIVADHLSDLCFAPTEQAMSNLQQEGLLARAALVGDIMLDTTVRSLRQITTGFINATLSRFGVGSGEFALATTHRAHMRENPGYLRNILEALREMVIPVILPLHPSTRAAILQHGMQKLIEPGTNFLSVPPVKYAEMLALLCHCRMVLTDSGGLTKEAYYFKKPCVTFDFQTEWTETLNGGWNRLIGPDKQRILEAAAEMSPDPAVHRADLFGTGKTARAILDFLRAGR